MKAISGGGPWGVWTLVIQGLKSMRFVGLTVALLRKDDRSDLKVSA